jgi:glycosyltransferase involved in cell wall biosynthesis
VNIGIDIRPLQLSSANSGTGVYIRSLVSAISRLDRENSFFLLTVRGRKPPALPLSPGFNCQLFPLPCPPIEHLNVLRDRLFLAGELKKLSLNAVHFPGPLEMKLNFDLGRDNAHSIVTMLDLTPLYFRERIFIKRRKLLQPLYFHLLRQAGKAAAIITISENTRKDVIRDMGIPGGRVFTTHLGKSPAFRPIEDPSLLEALRARYSLPERFILYLGGFSLHKNVEGLLAAMEILSSRHSCPAPLVIAGKADPFFQASLAQKIESLGIGSRVFFCGFIPDEDLPGLYNLAKLFVFPSLYEGFGLPVLEAMACGTPVACSGTSSLPEVAGDAALYFNPENPGEIAHAIHQALTVEKTAAEMREKGLAQAEKFTWEKTAGETLELYYRMGKQ